MQNDPRSHGLWELTAPTAPATETLAANLNADVAIVGAGYTGLSAALHLAQAGVRVALIDAVEVGFGGAGRNVGLVNAGMWVMPSQLVSTMGDAYGERLLTLLGNAPSVVFDLIRQHGIACEAEHAGTLHCGHGKSGLDEITARAEQWHKRGADVELLDADQAAKKLGTSKYAGALLDRRAGTIQPLAYARGLATAALKAGARIFTKSPVRTIDRKDGRWQVHGDDGAISAEWVIVATDAYGTGPGLPVRKEQVLLPYFNFATKPLPPDLRATILPEKQGAWDTQLVMTSFRMDHAGRLVFGSVGALRSTGLAVHRSWASRALRKLFPKFREVVFEAEWFGMIGMTNDNLPRFHKYADRMIGFSGYNGRGIAPGTTFGRTLAHYVTGEIRDSDLPLPVTPIEKANFRIAKQTFYEVGSQLAHIVSARAPGSR